MCGDSREIANVREREREMKDLDNASAVESFLLLSGSIGTSYQGPKGKFLLSILVEYNLEIF